MSHDEWLKEVQKAGCSICGGPLLDVESKERFLSAGVTEKDLEGWFGHNARPINDGRCCGICNEEVVAARFERHAKGLPMQALDEELTKQ